MCYDVIVCCYFDVTAVCYRHCCFSANMSSILLFFSFLDDRSHKVLWPFLFHFDSLPAFFNYSHIHLALPTCGISPPGHLSCTHRAFGPNIVCIPELNRSHYPQQYHFLHFFRKSMGKEGRPGQQREGCQAIRMEMLRERAH